MLWVSHQEMSVLQTLDLNDLNWWESTLGVCVSKVSVISLSLIYPRSTCSVAAAAVCNTTPVYEDITPPATRNIACVKLKSTSQASRHKDWHGLCYGRLLFSYWNSITGSTSSYSYCMSQVVRRHMRTRLQPAHLMKINFWLSLSANQHRNPSWVIGFE